MNKKTMIKKQNCIKEHGFISCEFFNTYELKNYIEKEIDEQESESE